MSNHNRTFRMKQNSYKYNRKATIALSIIAAFLLMCVVQPFPSNTLGFEPSMLGNGNLNLLSSTPFAQEGIEDPDGTALLSFYGSLFRSRGGRDVTRIIHFGDSHVAADIMTGALRRYFQQDFGDAGPGFILAGKPYPYYSRSGVQLGATTGWVANGLRQDDLLNDSRFGLAGVSFTTNQVEERIWVKAACSSFDIYLRKQPNGGAIEVTLDGMKVISNYSLNSERVEPAYIKIGTENDSPHIVQLRTVSPGQVRIFGITAEKANAGVIYDALGINGARASRPLAWDWQIVTDQLIRRNPALIILAYGSNEVGDANLNLNDYRKKFMLLLKKFREAVPNASILVVAPPDRAAQVQGHWQTISALPELVKMQKEAAFATGAAFFNMFSAMGGPGSIQQWASRPQPLAQADRVHLTSSGYKMVADILYEELLRGYQQNLGLMLHDEKRQE
jgi:lysophospholipase L1-like esterase